MTGADKIILGAALVLSLLVNAWLAGHAIALQEAMGRMQARLEQAGLQLERAHARLAERRRG